MGLGRQIFPPFIISFFLAQVAFLLLVHMAKHQLSFQILPALTINERKKKTFINPDLGDI